jgi:acyl dehydratase
MTTTVAGPYFDDLEIGQIFDTAPGCTLTSGRAALHQAIVGDRWRLALDDHLAVAVAGERLASPNLVWDVAIGQSTLATQRVRANLFYRQLALKRQPAIGDTLRTVTTVVGLRENTRREGRPATGLAALHMRTTDQLDRPVLDFYRCAMLPLAPGAAPTGHADDLDAIGSQPVNPSEVLPDWPRLPELLKHAVPAAGDRFRIESGDVVSSAPELARLTLNIAAVHHDRFVQGERLVYGGHTISIATSQVLRALPGLATVLTWESCDHTGPVREGDTLTTEVEVVSVESVHGWHIVELRALVMADGDRSVLDWRFSALHP